MADTTIHNPRMRGFRSRSSVEGVHRRIDDRASALGPEAVPLFESHGRVLANRVAARLERAATSTARRWTATPSGARRRSAPTPTRPPSFRVIGRSRPGAAVRGHGRAGRGRRDRHRGADAGRRGRRGRRSNRPAIRRRPSWSPSPRRPGRHVGLAGEDVALGDGRVRAGPGPPPAGPRRPERPGPVARSRSSGGPRVAILITGDEILPAGSPPAGCRIADMNRPDARRPGRPRRRPRPRRRARCPTTGRPSAARSTRPAATSDARARLGGHLDGPRGPRPVARGRAGRARDPRRRPAAREPVGPRLRRGRARRAAAGQPGELPVRLRPVRRPDRPPPRGRGRPTGRIAGSTAPLAEKLVSGLGRVDYARVRLVDGAASIPLATSGASILSSTTRADGFVLVPAERKAIRPVPKSRSTCTLSDGS